MVCLICGSESDDTLHSTSRTISNRVLGRVTITVENAVCASCHNKDLPKRIPINLARAFDRVAYQAEQEEISNLPVKEFASCSQAAEILKISKQAVYKIIKTRRRALMTTLIDGKFLIYKPSLVAYKETGDGLVSPARLPRRLRNTRGD